MTRRDIKIREIAYHRNGISGEGFHVVLFDWREGGAKPLRHMLATVFPLEDGQEWNGRVAVLDTDMLATGDISFGSNSWRGDNFEEILRDAVATWYAERSGRWTQQA